MFSSNFSSLTSFLKESGSSCLRGSNGCSGRNSVWITNRAAIFESSIHCFPSTVMVAILSMNPYIDSSVAVMSNARGTPSQYDFPDFVYPTLGVRFCVVV